MHTEKERKRKKGLIKLLKYMYEKRQEKKEKERRETEKKRKNTPQDNKLTYILVLNFNL